MIDIFKIIKFKYSYDLNTGLFFDIDESKPIANRVNKSIRPIIIFFDDKTNLYYYLRCTSTKRPNEIEIVVQDNKNRKSYVSTTKLFLKNYIKNILINNL